MGGECVLERIWEGCVLWRALAGGASPPVALEWREYRGECVLEWRVRWGELWGGLGVSGVRVRVACMQKRWQDTLSASVKTSARPQAARECYTSYFAPRTLHFRIVLTGNKWGAGRLVMGRLSEGGAEWQEWSGQFCHAGASLHGSRRTKKQARGHRPRGYVILRTSHLALRNFRAPALKSFVFRPLSSRACNRRGGGTCPRQCHRAYRA